jgi:hypothetical protein
VDGAKRDMKARRATGHAVDRVLTRGVIVVTSKGSEAACLSEETPRTRRRQPSSRRAR